MKMNSIFVFIGVNNSKYKNYKGIGLIDDNNLRQGYWEYYFNNGKLCNKGNYVNGLKNGYWVFYWSNGQLFSKGKYVNGIKDGYWEFYWKDGKLDFKRNYVNDKFYEDNILNRIKLFFK